MALNCDISVGRAFPAILACLLQDNYSETQLRPTKYLGGNTLSELLRVDVVVFVDNASDTAIFMHWWYTELDQGQLDFEIELPIFGVTQLYTAKIVTDVTTKLAGSVGKKINLTLEIQDDVAAILETAICSDFGTICN